MHDFTRLDVWAKARVLGADIYRACGAVTQPEARAVTSQLRRSALSISANIAEGCGKRSRAEAIRYLEIASGSAAETEHHLFLAADLNILARPICDRFRERVVEVRRMLRGLITHFPADSPRH